MKSHTHAVARSSQRDRRPIRTLAEVHDAITTCNACARLRDYCAQVAREKRRAFRDDHYWGRPVPGFGDPAARLLVIGLAPAAHGANRTGRVFTGDGTGGSGDFLMTAMHRHGFASLPVSRHRDDALVLRDAYIAAAVRCAPPGNKPLPEEIARCLPHLEAEVALLPNLKVVVALGKIGFDAWWRLLKRRYAEPAGLTGLRKPAFAHAAVYTFGPPVPALVASYHPSRQNTNTGKLTAAMMSRVFHHAKCLIQRSGI